MKSCNLNIKTAAFGPSGRNHSDRPSAPCLPLSETDKTGGIARDVIRRRHKSLTESGADASRCEMLRKISPDKVLCQTAEQQNFSRQRQAGTKR